MCSQNIQLFENNICEAVELASKMIKNGKVIAVPTDTIYGLACSAKNKDAIQSLYDIKGRDMNKPLAICVGDINDIKKWCVLTVTNDLLSDLLPGQVTVVLERSQNLNKDLNPLTDLVGVRIPNYEFMQKLSMKCGSLALTSANVSTHDSTLSVDEFKAIWPKLEGVFDGGSLESYDPLRLGSTVVDLSVKNGFKIIRDGCALNRTIDILQNKHLLKRIY